MTDPGALIVYQHYVLAIALVYLFAVLFPKLAILAIYLHVFTDKLYRKACWFLGGLLVANTIGSTVAGVLMCVPLNYLWDRSIDGHCFDIPDYLRYIALVNIVTDVVMLVLPLPLIWKLRISRNVKLGLTCTFATGSVYVPAPSPAVPPPG
jgi:hypothetical protein